MSKLLLAFLALDIGVSLSKVYIFTWNLNFLAIEKFITKKGTYLFFFDISL